MFGTKLINFPEVREHFDKFLVGTLPTYISESMTFPKQFDGRRVWKKYLSSIKDQRNYPVCWAAAASTMLSDRYSILSLGDVHQDLSLSDSVMCMVTNSTLEMVVAENAGSIGSYTIMEKQQRQRGIDSLYNSLYNVGKFMFIYGAPTEKCIPDELVTAASSVASIPMCESVAGSDFDQCLDNRKAQRYYRALRAYRCPTYPEQSKMEKAIQMEIYKWGPIAAGFLIYDDFSFFSGKGIYDIPHGNSNDSRMGHAVVIRGWGEEIQDGRMVKYWILANSWGEKWGDGGHFKMERFLAGSELEQNTMCLIPALFGILNTGIDPKNSFITDEDRQARRLLGVDLETFLPSSAVEKMMVGALGAPNDILEHVVHSDKLPANYDTFIAGRINEYDFKKITRGCKKKSGASLLILVVATMMLMLILVLGLLLG